MDGDGIVRARLSGFNEKHLETIIEHLVAQRNAKQGS
jgi:hypothetical protein